MELNDRAEAIIREATNRAKGKTSIQRWELYESYKGRLAGVCAWGREYEVYIIKLTEGLRI